MHQGLRGFLLKHVIFITKFVFFTVELSERERKPFIKLLDQGRKWKWSDIKTIINYKNWRSIIILLQRQYRHRCTRFLTCTDKHRLAGHRINRWRWHGCLCRHSVVLSLPMPLEQGKISKQLHIIQRNGFGVTSIPPADTDNEVDNFSLFCGKAPCSIVNWLLFTQTTENFLPRED